MEVEVTRLKSALESADELAAKDFAEDFLGKEVVFSCVDPTAVIGREAAGGDDAMNGRVKNGLLAPKVKDTEETGFRTQVFRDTECFQEGFRTGTEQKTEDNIFFLQDPA